MKGTTITVWCLAALMSVPIQAQTDSFEELFGQAKDRVMSYLYKDRYGAVTPQWKDPYTFCYETLINAYSDSFTATA